MAVQERVLFEIERMLAFALKNDFLEREDLHYARNRLIDLFGLDAPRGQPFEGEIPETPEEILSNLLDCALDMGLMPDNTTTRRDLFDTRIMGLLLPPPSCVRRMFNEKRAALGIKGAMDWFYQISCHSNYIRMGRIEKNLEWTAGTRYGDLVITINLSKPEKDPVEIAATRDLLQTHYPKCMLCPENVGYAGRLNFPARQTLRTLPLDLNGEKWHFQFSPYVYYYQHCIALREEHVPMLVNEKTLIRLADFIDTIPHFFIGSNAGLPVVGGSILNHDHFQGGNCLLPMQKAGVTHRYAFAEAPDVKTARVKWPMSTIRLTSKNRGSLLKAGARVLNTWADYSDEARNILACSGGEPRNAVTPILRRDRGAYVLDIVLRNNVTTDEFPLGLYHPHTRHNIKKENIGLIEVMGLFILPGRLQDELFGHLKPILCGRAPMTGPDYEQPDHPLYQHRAFILEMAEKWGTSLGEREAEQAIREELGFTCLAALHDCGVFKDTRDGMKGFNLFMQACGMELIK